MRTSASGKHQRERSGHSRKRHRIVSFSRRVTPPFSGPRAPRRNRGSSRRHDSTTSRARGKAHAGDPDRRDSRSPVRSSRSGASRPAPVADAPAGRVVLEVTARCESFGSLIRAIRTARLPLMDAAALTCPQCGAAAAADAIECSFCHARLATTACPSCFGLVFVGSKHCAHCGAAITAVQAQASALPCPRGCGTLRAAHARRRRAERVRAAAAASGSRSRTSRSSAPRRSVAPSFSARKSQAHRTPSAGRADGALRPLPALREADEPDQLRKAIGRRRRQLCEARHLVRRRRAAPRRRVRARRWPRPRAGRGEGAARGGASPTRARARCDRQRRARAAAPRHRRGGRDSPFARFITTLFGTM